MNANHCRIEVIMLQFECQICDSYFSLFKQVENTIFTGGNSWNKQFIYEMCLQITTFYINWWKVSRKMSNKILLSTCSNTAFQWKYLFKLKTIEMHGIRFCSWFYSDGPDNCVQKMVGKPKSRTFFHKQFFGWYRSRVF